MITRWQGQGIAAPPMRGAILGLMRAVVWVSNNGCRGERVHARRRGPCRWGCGQGSVVQAFSQKQVRGAAAVERGSLEFLEIHHGHVLHTLLGGCCELPLPQ